MNLQELANYLSDGGIVTQGKDLFIHNMPAKVDSGVLLRGKLTGTPINHELPGYRRTGFQAVIRHTDYKEGFELAETVSSELTFKGGDTVLGSIVVKHILPKHEPVVFPVSEGDFLEFSVNFDAVYIQN